MTGYRATENEEETAGTREEDRLRTGLKHELQFQREREEREELPASNALQHAEIVPVETKTTKLFFVRCTLIATDPETYERIEFLAKTLL